MRYPFILATAILAAVVFGAPPADAAKAPDSIAAAVADANRPDSDKQRDANRKPAETLAFTGVRPGDHVAELMPGGGYFTRLFSKLVGPGGHVYALVPAPLPDAPADRPDFAARVKAIAADPNYTNVSVVVEPFSELKTPEPVDLVWTSQNYHDLHNFPGLDVGVFNKSIFDALKPGGIYVVLDHAAEPGSGLRDTATLHRIDAETAKKEILAAGFVFVGGSDLLRDPADAHTVKVFDPSVRGKTDQFILKFRKPGK
ncbi:MAG: methyltransferase [Pseudomonadota bacterium]|nr:methyltransferase [Pseudomonadota bacterium]